MPFTFVCATAACLPMWLGIGSITMQSGNTLIYESPGGTTQHFCYANSGLYKCTQVKGRNATAYRDERYTPYGLFQ